MLKPKTRLLVETLEERCVPAGIVTITLWGTNSSNVNVVGDAQDNQIDITGSGSGTLTITGLSGTTLVFGSVASTSFSINLSAGLGQLLVDLKAGDDQAGVFNVQANGNILILPGDGNDSLRLGADKTLKALLIHDNLGHDRVMMDNVKAHDPSVIFTGVGNDYVFTAGSGTIFDQDLSIYTGAGSDRVVFYPGQSLIKGNLRINTTSLQGDGGDNVLVYGATQSTAPHTLKVLGTTRIRTGNGADLVKFGGFGPSFPGPSVDLQNTDIRTGNHNDRIWIEQATFNVLTVLLEGGADSVLNNWGTSNVSVAPLSTLDGGPPPLGDLLPAGWIAPTGLSVTDFP